MGPYPFLHVASAVIAQPYPSNTHWCSAIEPYEKSLYNAVLYRPGERQPGRAGAPLTRDGGSISHSRQPVSSTVYFLTTISLLQLEDNGCINTKIGNSLPLFIGLT